MEGEIGVYSLGQINFIRTISHSISCVPVLLRKEKMGKITLPAELVIKTKILLLIRISE